MITDSFSLQEMQSVHNSVIVVVPLFQICMPSRQMSGQEAEARVVIVKPNPDCTFIPGYSSQTSLASGCFDTSNVSCNVRADDDNKSRAD